MRISLRLSMAPGAGEHGVVRGVGVARGADPIGIAMVEWKERVIGGRQVGRQPCSGCMAGGAGGGPPGRSVIRICCPGKIRLMAGVAIRRCSRKNIIDVALDATHGHMRAGQRERRVVVIEGGSGPRRCGVTSGACCGESRCGVRGVRSAVVIGLVARIAIGRHCCVVAANVAQSAGNSGVSAGEWEGRRVVIERRRSPVGGRVADRAVRREAGGHVIGVCCPREVGLVAGVACCGRCCVVVVRVALHAVQRCVRPCQRIVGIRCMIEHDRCPVGGGMAGVTSGGEGCGYVTWIRGSGEILLMAAVAIRGQRRVVVVCVASCACDRSVCAGQREHRRVIERRRGPVTGRVAESAIRRETR